MLEMLEMLEARSSRTVARRGYKGKLVDETQNALFVSAAYNRKRQNRLAVGSWAGLGYPSIRSGYGKNGG